MLATHTHTALGLESTDILANGCVSASPSVPQLCLSYHLTHTHMNTHLPWIYTYIWDSLHFYIFHSKHIPVEILPKKEGFQCSHCCLLNCRRSCSVNLQKAFLRNTFASGRKCDVILLPLSPHCISCRSLSYLCLKSYSKQEGKQIALSLKRAHGKLCRFYNTLINSNKIHIDV